MTIRFTLSAAAVAAATLFATAANAAPCTGVSLGTSATGDFTLGGVDSDACVISTVNPDQGPNGNPSGFSPTPFGTGWTLLAKVNSDSSPTSFDGVSFSWSLGPQSGKSGTWTFGADQTVKVDLVVAMHAANRSGAFLFDDLELSANAIKNGTWNIAWLNRGGEVPDYSNSSFWLRDVTPVPEPSSYALALAGLGVLGLVVRRRRKA